MAAKKSTAISAARKAASKTTGRRSSSSGTTTNSSGKAEAKKTATKRSASAKKTATKKSAPAKKAAPAKRTAPAKKATTKKATPARSTAKGAPAKKAASKEAPAKKVIAAGAGGRGLVVRDGERPWTASQIKDVRATLEHDRGRLIAEIAATEQDIDHLLRGGGEGAGNDQADVGSNTFERDHEMSMAKNARDNLELVESALARIDRGAYGVCESCGQPIGKMRLQAFPRATLCMECKQRQERR